MAKSCLLFLQKSFILDVRLGFEYASELNSIHILTFRSKQLLVQGQQQKHLKTPERHRCLYC